MNFTVDGQTLTSIGDFYVDLGTATRVVNGDEVEVLLVGVAEVKATTLTTPPTVSALTPNQAVLGARWLDEPDELLDGVTGTFLNRLAERRGLVGFEIADYEILTVRVKNPE